MCDDEHPTNNIVNKVEVVACAQLKASDWSACISASRARMLTPSSEHPRERGAWERVNVVATTPPVHRRRASWANQAWIEYVGQNNVYLCTHYLNRAICDLFFLSSPKKKTIIISLFHYIEQTHAVVTCATIAARTEPLAQESGIVSTVYYTSHEAKKSSWAEICARDFYWISAIHSFIAAALASLGLSTEIRVELRDRTGYFSFTTLDKGVS